ncbi:unnamed protein product [Linum tenue]|uniref:Uncharacterized protein n=1 Tax=Linum tenue TaxID=586396 RepID=A0AAV0IMQ7_9ROSI|nr:unnamed protein product [Linum tenue]
MDYGVYAVEEYLRTKVKTRKTNIEKISRVYCVSIDPRRVYLSSPTDIEFKPSKQVVVEFRELGKVIYLMRAEIPQVGQGLIMGPRRNVIEQEEEIEIDGNPQISAEAVDLQPQELVVAGEEKKHVKKVFEWLQVMDLISMRYWVNLCADDHSLVITRQGADVLLVTLCKNGVMFLNTNVVFEMIELVRGRCMHEGTFLGFRERHKISDGDSKLWNLFWKEDRGEAC